MLVKEGPPPTRSVNANAALFLLLAINLFNYIDRQVLAAVEPEIRKELLEGVADDQAKFRMGLLSTAFLISYMLLAPVFGWLADRWSRWWLVGIGVILWSLASGASGIDWPVSFAAAYWLLLITRCFVGVGEGAYGPIAPAMIADLYPVARRGRVMALFYLAIPVGGALGYAFGEVIKNMAGWRWAFYAVVPPGILLGIWSFFMPDPPRGAAVQTNAPKPGWDQYRALLRIPSYFFNTLGMTGMTFAIGGLAYWMPAYLEENQVPDVGPLGPRTFFGAITAVSGLLATLSGGILGDKLRGRFSGSYFLVSGLALMLGFPMVLGFLYTPFPAAWIFVFLAVFCLFFNTGPTNTILANVTHPSVRSSAFALNILIIHALGDAISPPVIGLVADRWDLRLGFVVVSAVMMLGGLFWLLGMKHLQRDMARVEQTI
jgi:MFS family permease